MPLFYFFFSPLKHQRVSHGILTGFSSTECVNSQHWEIVLNALQTENHAFWIGKLGPCPWDAQGNCKSVWEMELQAKFILVPKFLKTIHSFFTIPILHKQSRIQQGEKKEMKPGPSYGIQMGLVNMKQCLRKATSAARKWPLDLQSLRPVNLSNSERDSLKRNAIYLGISWEH